MRNNKGITIAALIVAIIGLSIGFAAFSNTLTIRSTASVNPSDENFQVKFSKVSSADQTGLSYPIAAVDVSTGATGGNAIIDGDNPLLLKDLKANFTAPGQSVSYQLYIRNTGQYTAYLTNINFKNVSGHNDVKLCYGDQATQSLITSACNDMNVSVRIGGSVNGTTYTSNNNNISNTSLAPGDSTEVYVTITYADNTPNANHYVDGPMYVEFGDIMIEYRSVDSPLAIPEPEEKLVLSPEYVVTSGGVITEYNGTGGNLEIPSSLPLYRSAGKETVNVEQCIPAAIQGGAASTTDEARTACTQLKADVESGDTSHQFYGPLKGAGIIGAAYYETGHTVTVTSIGNNAFYEKSLTSVTLPNTLQSIGDDAFADNSLSSISIPNSVTSIGARAFLFNNLTTVTIGSGIETIGIDAFASGTNEGYGPNNLSTVTIHANCNNFAKDHTNRIVGINNNGQFDGFSGTITWDTACN